MKLHPLQGDPVTAKPSGWNDDSDDAPLLENVPKTLSGILHCHLIRLPTTSYVKCIVAGYDVDPDTIIPTARPVAKPDPSPQDITPIKEKHMTGQQPDLKKSMSRKDRNRYADQIIAAATAYKERTNPTHCLWAVETIFWHAQVLMVQEVGDLGGPPEGAA